MVLYCAMSRFFPSFFDQAHIPCGLLTEAYQRHIFWGVVSVLDGVSITGPLLPLDVKELCRGRIQGDMENNKNLLTVVLEILDAKIQRSPEHFLTADCYLWLMTRPTFYQHPKFQIRFHQIRFHHCKPYHITRTNNQIFHSTLHNVHSLINLFLVSS